MWLLRERLCDFWVKHLTSSSLYVHLKNSNHLRSHSRAIMALDHSRLGLENKILENISGRFFCLRQVYFTNSILPANLGVCKPTFYTFYTSPLRWNSISQFFKANCTQSIFRMIKLSWAFSETVKKNSKITYRKKKNRQSVHTFDRCVWMNINRVTLQHNKEIIMFTFLINSFIMMCTLTKRFIRAAFWVLLQAMFMNDWKQTAQWLKY